MFSLSFLSFMGKGQAPVHDITLHIPHEHFLAQRISSSCSLQRVPAALTIVTFVMHESLCILPATPELPRQNATFNGEKMRISHRTDKWERYAHFYPC